jgi:hypothetical protein
LYIENKIQGGHSMLKMWILLTHAFLDAKMSSFRACALLPLITVGLSISLCCEASTPDYSSWYPNGPGGMPVDAIVGAVGDEGNFSGVEYLCRAHYGYTLQPGFAVANGSVCTFSYGGLALTSAEFDWYVPAWEPATGQAMPANAIVLGTETLGSGSYLYSCLVGQTPGKYSPDFGACYYPYGGLEMHQQAPGFSYLVDPGWNVTPSGVITGADESSNGNNFGPYQFNGDGLFDDPIDMIAGRDTDGSLLYFCVASFEGGLHPGKARADWNACDVSWGGTEHFIASPLNGGVFYFLSANYREVHANINPVPVGYDSDGSTLFSCTVNTNLGFVLGKTKLAWNYNCSYPLNGVEAWSASFAVLSDGVLP